MRVTRAVGEWWRGQAIRSAIQDFDHDIFISGYHHGVDPDLIKAIIYEEQTHKDPLETEREAMGFGETVGAGQITVGMYGKTRAELLDVHINIDIIGRYLHDLFQQPLIDASDPIGSVATSYNGGYGGVSQYGNRVKGYRDKFQNGTGP